MRQVIKARAAVLLEPGQEPQLTDIELRDPVGDEVLVRIDAVGICHTDITMASWCSKTPMVFGHEGAGTVLAAGPAATPRPGQQVVLTFASCGQCGNCVADRPAYCDQSTNLNMRGSRRDETSPLRLNGAPITAGFFGQSSFASHAIAGSRNAVALPAGMDPALAAPLGCSVQTGVGAVLNVLGAAPSVAVFGAGAVGLSAVMGARIAGAETIIAVDPVQERRALAAELGATTTIDPTSTDAAAEIIRMTGGVAGAVDTTARPEVISAAVGVLASRGTLALVGLGAPTAELPVTLIMGKGLTVRGVVEGDSDPQVFIPQLTRWYHEGRLPLDLLVSTFVFDDFASAWSAAKSATVIKPVLVT